MAVHVSDLPIILFSGHSHLPTHQIKKEAEGELLLESCWEENSGQGAPKLPSWLLTFPNNLPSLALHPHVGSYLLKPQGLQGGTHTPDLQGFTQFLYLLRAC